MKRIAVITLSWIGVFALLGGILVLLINAGAPNYDERAKEEFGSPESIRAIEKLFARIEGNPADIELKILATHSPYPTYSIIRRIPKNWIPAEFPYWGAMLNAELIEPTDVLSYHDSDNTLVAIEFSGTRYGCFVSRDPNRCPPRFERLNRLAETPLFITSRIGLNPIPKD
jgi:hypothetical protein